MSPTKIANRHARRIRALRDALRAVSNHGLRHGVTPDDQSIAVDVLRRVAEAELEQWRAAVELWRSHGSPGRPPMAIEPSARPWRRDGVGLASRQGRPERDRKPGPWGV